ncbi:MAG: hypothetical protein IAE78_30870 [Myxococcus sp.]|nr:hypothetical protein [Myxococcus sp.]
MKIATLVTFAVSASLLTACGGTVETSSCGPSGCTSSRSGTFSAQPVGGSCANSGECEGSLLCAANAPNGYCTMSCTSTASCPSGSTCVGDSSAAVCLKNCSTSSDCRPGYSCKSLTNGKRICDVQ